MGDIKIYSPSAIKVYAECPMKHELQYIDRIVPKEAGRMFWGGVAGDGFGHGVAYWYRTGRTTLDGALFEAEAVMLREVVAFTMAGGLFVKTDFDSVLADVKKALEKYTKNDPLAKWTELQTEVSLPQQYGRARLDFVGRNEQGVLSWADLKFKRNLASDWVAKTVTEFQDDWQFHHYAWATALHYKEPVNNYLLLVRLKSAWQAQLFEFVYDPDFLRIIGQSVERWSESMDRAANRGPALGTTHYTKWGPCPYKDACLKYRFDEELMKQSYIHVGRTDVVASDSNVDSSV